MQPRYMLKAEGAPVNAPGSAASAAPSVSRSTFVSDNFSLTPNWITKKFGLDKPSAEDDLI